jgi:hypothetical protein
VFRSLMITHVFPTFEWCCLSYICIFYRFDHGYLQHLRPGELYLRCFDSQTEPPIHRLSYIDPLHGIYHIGP